MRWVWSFLASMALVVPVLASAASPGTAQTAPQPRLDWPWAPGDQHGWTSGPHGSFHDAKGRFSLCQAADPCATDVPLDLRAGLDFGRDPSGQDVWQVHPMAAGQVVYSGALEAGFGYGVVVDHGGDWQTVYAHMSEAGLHAVGPVTRTDLLGMTDRTGCPGCGKHLHVDLRTGAGSSGGTLVSGTRHSWDGMVIDGWTIHADALNYDGRVSMAGEANRYANTDNSVKLVAAPYGAAGPADPAAVESHPTDLPTRLPWPAGTQASVTSGYREGFVPGNDHAVRFGLAPGIDVIAATIGDILYAGPATGRFAALGTIVVERRMVGTDDYELLYTGLATTLPPVSFVDSEHVIGTVGPDGLGFAIYRGAQLAQGTDTGLIGGTPVYPEPLLGEGLYEHFAWWHGPMTAMTIGTGTGDPVGTWAKGSTRDGGHVAFGNMVDLVANVHDSTDVRELRFTVYYPDWADPKAAAKLQGFDPGGTWRIVAVCQPKGADGEPDRAKGCIWKGDAREATVTYHWDPTKDESKPSVPWLPEADAAITADSDDCVAVTLGIDIVDASGYRASAPGGRAAKHCDPKATDIGRTVFLDPPQPPDAPSTARVTGSGSCIRDNPCGADYRITWSRVAGATGYRIYVENAWMREGAGCPGETDGILPRHIVKDVGADVTSWNGRFIPEWRGTRLLYGSRYSVAALGIGGTSKARVATNPDSGSEHIMPWGDVPECFDIQ